MLQWLLSNVFYSKLGNFGAEKLSIPAKSGPISRVLCEKLCVIEIMEKSVFLFSMAHFSIQSSFLTKCQLICLYQESKNQLR